jgi:hypothetical protein
LPELRPKTRLPPISLSNADLVVALGEVEFGKPLSAPRLVQQSVNVRKRLDKGLSYGVETPIVIADSPGTVGLARKYNRRRVTRRRRLDPASVQQVQELPAELG